MRRPVSRAALGLALSIVLAAGPAAGAPAVPAPTEWSLAALAQLPPAARPIDLAEAWQIAQASAPQLLAARAARAAAATLRTQGFAQLLPQISAGGYRGRTLGVQRAPDFFGDLQESELRYTSTSAFVQLRQPVIDYGRYSGWRWSQARAAQGEAEYALATVQVASTLARAWYRAHATAAELALRSQLAASLAAQEKAIRALYQHQEGSIIDARQTQARLEAARAEVIRAQAEEQIARRELQTLLLTPLDPPDRASAAAAASLPALLPPILPLEHWLAQAQTSAAQLAAARARSQVASQEIKRALAQFTPVLSFSGAWQKAESENLDTLSQRTNTYRVGLQLDIPLFSGGANSAAHAQARAQYRSALATEAAAGEQSAAQITTQYQDVIAGAQRVTALRRAQESAAISLEGASKAYEFGSGGLLDLLRAQDNYYNIASQLSQAGYNYLLARSNLMLLAGSPATAIFGAETQYGGYFYLQSTPNHAAPAQ